MGMAVWPQSISPDGQLLLINGQNATTGGDLFLVPLTGDHKPVPFIQTPREEVSGRIAPSGQAVAYVSDESDRREVYVESFPTRGNKVRVSDNGGSFPVWSADGKALYFLTGPAGGQATLMVAEDRGGRWVSRKVFDLPPGPRDVARRPYAVFDDGRKFLVAAYVFDTAPHTITVGLNWPAGLGK